MPRTRFRDRAQRSVSVVVTRPTEILRAAASRVNLATRKARDATAGPGPQEWQVEGWNYFDEVPEVKSGVLLAGAKRSRVRLYVGVPDPKDPNADPIPVDDARAVGIAPGLAADAIAELERLGDPTQILRSLAINMELAGDCYLVGFGARTIALGDKMDVPEHWVICSISEVGKSNDTFKIKRSPTDPGVNIDKERDTVIRLWQQHARYGDLPDCHMRGVLGECEALVLLQQQVKAEAKARINAGLLLLPNELGFGNEDADETDTDSGDDATTDPLMDEIALGLTDAIDAPDSAASVTPTMLRGPAEALAPQGGLRHVEIKREMTQVLEQRIEARVVRIARGMNWPVEVTLGHQETTFANAAQVSEDEYVKYDLPALTLYANQLTEGFLLPQLLDVDEFGEPTRYTREEVAHVRVWFDATDLVKQSDPLDAADQGLTLDLISEETWRRLKGFEETDKPTPQERLIRLLFKVRTFDPGITTAIMELLGVPLNIPDELPSAGTSGTASMTPALRAVVELALQRMRAGEEFTEIDFVNAVIGSPVSLPAPTRALSAARSKRSGKGKALGRKLVAIDQDLRARLVTAASAQMTKVLTRAGNRLRNKLTADAKRTYADVPTERLVAELGRRLVAAAGISDDDLIGDDAFDELEDQFRTWASNAQKKALDAVRDFLGEISPHTADVYDARGVASIDEGWSWLRDALHDLADARLYGPEPTAALGEFDPTSKVPTGLIREALSRAGGASGLTATDQQNSYVVLNDGDPAGGVATGESVTAVLHDGGAAVEGYEWAYGEAFRLQPFEPHEALDGEEFTSFDSDVLASSDDWIGPQYFPGDHDGCACDVIPTWLAADELEEGQ